MKMHQLQRHDDDQPYTVQPGDTTHELLFDHNVDIFAFTVGPYCNGPRCMACGEAKCHHHYPDWWLGECSA